MKVRLACLQCGHEFEVDEVEAKEHAPEPLEEPYLVVPEHEAPEGVRCGGSLVPGEFRGNAA
jgi:hypothetical protein